MSGELFALEKVTGIKHLLANDLRAQIARLCVQLDRLNELLGNERVDLDLLPDEEKSEILRQIQAINRFRFHQ